MSLPSKPLTKKRSHTQSKRALMLVAVSRQRFPRVFVLELFRWRHLSRQSWWYIARAVLTKPNRSITRYASTVDCTVSIWFMQWTTLLDITLNTSNVEINVLEEDTPIQVPATHKTSDKGQRRTDYCTSSFVARFGRVPWTWRATILGRRIVARSGLHTAIATCRTISKSRPSAVDCAVGIW